MGFGEYLAFLMVWYERIRITMNMFAMMIEYTNCLFEGFRFSGLFEGFRF